MYSGARLTDCTTMRWENVDLEKRLIYYYSTKNTKDLILPMHTTLFDYITALGSQNAKDSLITPILAGRSTSGKSGLSGTFTRLMETAGIDPLQVEGKGKRKFSQKSFHSLRHTFNSILANSGVSQENRMKLIGHASKHINDQYTNVQIQTLRQEIEKLPSFTL